MRSSLGHEATDNNQMTPKCLSHLVLGHYEKLLPLDELRLSRSYRWPWSSSTHVECRLFSGPLHHLLLSDIWKDAFSPYTDAGNKFSSLSSSMCSVNNWSISCLAFLSTVFFLFLLVPGTISAFCESIFLWYEDVRKIVMKDRVKLRHSNRRSIERLVLFT